jgi:prepilin-type N-terminal cleavage/methylation domain-containing protein
MKKNNKGFSLIELIIAIAILVILTGLLAPQFMRYIEKSREAKDMQTLDTVYEAAQAALTTEEAYTEIADAAIAKSDNTLNLKLNGGLSSYKTFESEMKASLGDDLSKVTLVSRAANSGVVYLRIKFTKAAAASGSGDTATSATSLGMEISVYCGDDTEGKAGTKTGTLDVVGTQF